MKKVLILLTLTVLLVSGCMTGTTDSTTSDSDVNSLDNSIAGLDSLNGGLNETELDGLDSDLDFNL